MHDQCRYYCANVELKEVTKQESCVERIILLEDNYENQCKEQIRDPCIYLFLFKKEAGKERPLQQEVAAKDLRRSVLILLGFS